MVALLKMPRRISENENFKIDPRERRMFVRKEVMTHVEGRRIDHTIAARQQPQLALSLRDLSFGGLAALSDQPLEPGERVAVFFPPQGAKRGWDACGRVIRCDRAHLGYRIAVEFDPLPMAA